MPPEPETEITDVVYVGPVGLGGWLVLPIIGLFGTILAVTLTTFSETIPGFRSGGWALLFTPGTESYHPGWAAFLVFRLIVDAVRLASSATLLRLVFQRKASVPRLMVWFYGFCCTAAVVSVLVAFSLGSRWSAAGTAKSLVVFVLTDVIWIPYFLKSERVKNTFAGASQSKPTGPMRPAPAASSPWADRQR
jgi:hypothetical protein